MFNKKLLVSIIVLTSIFVFFNCNKKSDPLDPIFKAEIKPFVFEYSKVVGITRKIVDNGTGYMTRTIVDRPTYSITQNNLGLTGVWEKEVPNLGNFQFESERYLGGIDVHVMTLYKRDYYWNGYSNYFIVVQSNFIVASNAHTRYTLHMSNTMRPGKTGD